MRRGRSTPYLKKGEERAMGTLIAMARPISLSRGHADHTYVKCGTGKRAWGCWGGKTGGRVLRRGTGSTRRADKIAQPNERAGITCYLINGVCHQAANRILLPAGITVRGARGYNVSEALFGTYGRVGYWPCRAPFNRYQNVTGDLGVCVPAPVRVSRAKMAATRALTDADKLDWHYIQGVLAIYGQAARMMKARAVDAGDASDFSVKLFMHMAEFHLGNMLDRPLSRKLTQLRRKIEKARVKAEAAYASDEMPAQEFVDDSNKTTIAFQDEMANVMKPEQYQTLFDLNPDERVELADPKIIKKVFGVK